MEPIFERIALLNGTTHVGCSEAFVEQNRNGAFPMLVLYYHCKTGFFDLVQVPQARASVDMRIRPLELTSCGPGWPTLGQHPSPLPGSWSTLSLPFIFQLKPLLRAARNRQSHPTLPSADPSLPHWQDTVSVWPKSAVCRRLRSTRSP